MINLEDLLQLLVERGASDLHISAGSPPRIRVDGKLMATEFDAMTKEDAQKLIYGILSEDQVARFEKELELDFSFGVENLGRFRTNVFMQRNAVGSVFRLVPHAVRGFDDLGLPRKVCQDLCHLPKGLVLVTGATGSGKSTTLAAMIDYINATQPCHIITVEDPIEFVHENKNSLINQREVGADTRGFKNALRTVLRQDPDVVMIGEMRDLETVEATLTISETGHLSFATLHTSDVTQTINRIIDIFPSHQQQQIRTQLSFTLSAVFCQQLIPRSNKKGRVLAVEILLANSAVRSLIREDKVHQIYSVVQTGGRAGMQTMNQSLFDVYKAGHLTFEDASTYSSDPEELKRMMQRGS
ncbi:MAG: type IV pili twitching motility protein PilT [Planctomycetes bacterium RBG_16_43_13]|nr:MAG: type IV pili twitching motility protein PilT [Planctomycetes bacterium RBG_16_43_13]